MIHKIEIKNLHSIRDRRTLDLRAPASAPEDTGRLAECWRGSDDRAPKVVAVFGANGSGKSNLLSALTFAAWFIRSSFSLAPDEGLPLRPFHDEVGSGKPTKLKLWLSGFEELDATAEDNGAECRYCYELEIGNAGGEARKVLSEGIFRWPTSTRRRTRLIERFEDGRVRATGSFDLSGHKGALEKVLRPNASVISTLVQLNHPKSAFIAESFLPVRSNILPEGAEVTEDAVLRRYIGDPQLVGRFSREIGRMDVGVSAVEVTRDGGLPRLRFRHEGLSAPMPVIRESQGTRRLLKLFPVIADTLERGGIAVIDEPDSVMHPMLLAEIVGWFHDPSRNPRDAQLWMSCRDASLMEELSKEEIVFCEKDKRGGTEPYCLNDVKGVRRNENFHGLYMSGILGAVPRIG